jgi:YHS domain-containing protein
MKKTPLILAVAALAPALGSVGARAQGHDKHAPAKKHTLICPVMKSPVNDPAAAPRLMVNNEPVYFCCPGCAPQVKKDPAKYLKQVKDPVTGKPFTVTARSPRMEHGGALFLFASAKTRDTFHAHPAKYAKPAPAAKHDAHHQHPSK